MMSTEYGLYLLYFFWKWKCQCSCILGKTCIKQIKSLSRFLQQASIGPNLLACGMRVRSSRLLGGCAAGEVVLCCVWGVFNVTFYVVKRDCCYVCFGAV